MHWCHSKHPAYLLLWGFTATYWAASVVQFLRYSFGESSKVLIDSAVFLMKLRWNNSLPYLCFFSINNWMQHKRMLSLLRLRLQGLSEQCHIFTKNPLNLLNLVSSSLKSFSRGCVWCWWEKRWGHRCQMYRIRDAGVWRLFSSPAVRGVYFWTAVFQVFTLAQNILEMTHYVNSSVCVRSSVTEGCFPSLSVFCGVFSAVFQANDSFSKSLLNS